MGSKSNCKEAPWNVDGVERISRALYHDFKYAFFGQREPKELRRFRQQLLRGDVPDTVDYGGYRRDEPTPETPDGKWYDFRTISERVRIDVRITETQSGPRIRVDWVLECDPKYHAWLVSPKNGLPEDVEGTLQYIIDLQRVRKRFAPTGALAEVHYPSGDTFPAAREAE